MFNLKTTLVCLTGLLSLTAAAPPNSQSVAHRSAPFSFENWVTEIAANPDGDHLSPEEAVRAAAESVGKRDLNKIDRRAPVCNQELGYNANASDVAKCIQRLAARGQQTCVATASHNTLCKQANAIITGNAGGGRSQVKTRCQNVATAAGRIMDRCWRSDNTVQGTNIAIGTKNFGVMVTAHKRR